MDEINSNLDRFWNDSIHDVREKVSQKQSHIQIAKDHTSLFMKSLSISSITDE